MNPTHNGNIKRICIGHIIADPLLSLSAAVLNITCPENNESCPWIQQVKASLTKPPKETVLWINVVHNLNTYYVSIIPSGREPDFIF